MALGSIFLSTVLLGFGFTLLVAGLFGSYFGQGRSRGIGFALALVAILLIGLFAALTWPLVPGIEPRFNATIIASSLVAVLAATIGSLLAVGTFVMSVMRS